jgi:hypothetical protein
MGVSGRSPLSHHTDVPHTEAEFWDVIETKVSLDSFPPALPWDYREITSLPTIQMPHTEAEFFDV